MSSKPKHVAIIMDGNRRWAKQKKLQFDRGHLQGAEQVQGVIEAAKEAGIKTLTLFAFSTENAARSKLEVATLMQLLESYLVKKRSHLIDGGIRLHTIGSLEGLPEKIQNTLESTKQLTEQGENFDLVLALGYGARDEICRAARSFASACASQLADPKDLDEKLFASYLDTSRFPDPDLLIRTGGEMRLSNFLLWQISYSEVYITETLWPDFTKDHLADAILEYQNRKRRFGK